MKTINKEELQSKILKCCEALKIKGQLVGFFPFGYKQDHFLVVINDEESKSNKVYGYYTEEDKIFTTGGSPRFISFPIGSIRDIYQSCANRAMEKVMGKNFGF